MLTDSDQLAEVKSLEWDSQFFGLPVGVLHSNGFTQVTTNNNYQLIYAVSAVPQNQFFISGYKASYQGSKLTFTGIPFKTELQGDFELRELTATDFNDKVVALAVQAGHLSRFKMDPNIPANKFEALYTTWILKSLSGEMANKVIGAFHGNSLIGLVTGSNQDGIVKVGLIAVSEKHQNKGVAKGLLYAISGGKRISITTQGNNKPAQAAFTAAGLDLCKTEYVRHFWRDFSTTLRFGRNDFETLRINSPLERNEMKSSIIHFIKTMLFRSFTTKWM